MPRTQSFPVLSMLRQIELPPQRRSNSQQCLSTLLHLQACGSRPGFSWPGPADSGSPRAARGPGGRPVPAPRGQCMGLVWAWHCQSLRQLRPVDGAAGWPSAQEAQEVVPPPPLPQEVSSPHSLLGDLHHRDPALGRHADGLELAVGGHRGAPAATSASALNTCRGRGIVEYEERGQAPWEHATHSALCIKHLQGRRRRPEGPRGRGRAPWGRRQPCMVRVRQASACSMEREPRIFTSFLGSGAHLAGAREPRGGRAPAPQRTPPSRSPARARRQRRTRAGRPPSHVPHQQPLLLGLPLQGPPLLLPLPLSPVPPSAPPVAYPAAAVDLLLEVPGSGAHPYPHPSLPLRLSVSSNPAPPLPSPGASRDPCYESHPLLLRLASRSPIPWPSPLVGASGGPPSRFVPVPAGPGAEGPWCAGMIQGCLQAQLRGLLCHGPPELLPGRLRGAHRRHTRHKGCRGLRPKGGGRNGTQGSRKHPAVEHTTETAPAWRAVCQVGLGAGRGAGLTREGDNVVVHCHRHTLKGEPRPPSEAHRHSRKKKRTAALNP